MSKTPTRGTARSIIALALLVITVIVSRAHADPAVARWPSSSDNGTAWIARESKLGQWAVLRITGAPPAMKIDNAGWMPRPVIALAGDSRRCVVLLRQSAGWYAVREISEPTKGPRGPIFTEPRALPPIPANGTPLRLRILENLTQALIAPEPIDGSSTTAPPHWIALIDGAWSPPFAKHENEPTDPLAFGEGSFALTRDNADIVISMRGSQDSALPDTETARLKDIPLESAVFNLRGLTTAVWERPDGTLWYAAISHLGLEVGRGPVTREGPLPGREAVTLGAVITSIFASVMLWVLVPVKWRGPISPPQGFTYAERSRRAAATIADLMPGFLIAEVLTRWLSWVPTDLLGVWPALIALALTVITTAAAESLFGVTLGKFAMRCRTVMPDGTRPSARRSIARNAAKFLCPPLTVLSLLIPPWQWTNPASLGTVVVIDDANTEAPPPTVQ